MREAEELEIADERTALQAQVARDHRLHLIEEQLLRDAPNDRNASSRPSMSVRMSWRR
jgi:hypothetical protein